MVHSVLPLHFATARFPEQDPVCKLEPRDKLRLCAILFGSVTFRDKVQFKPTMENVQPNCERKRISFRVTISSSANFLLKFTNRSLKSERNYEEWVIGCNAITADHRNKTYLVSRGHKRNTVFIYTYKYSDDRIFVRDYLRYVSVVGSVLEEDVKIDT